MSNIRPRADTKLRHKSRQYAEEGRAIEEVIFHQVVEAIGSRGDHAHADLHHKIPFAGGELAVKTAGAWSFIDAGFSNEALLLAAVVECVVAACVAGLVVFFVVEVAWGAAPTVAAVSTHASTAPNEI